MGSRVVSPEALSNLANDIAEVAAKCVGAEPSQVGASIRRHTAGESAVVACSAWAGEWSARASTTAGRNSDALNAAAVLALRDRVVAQREERARMLAADDAALRVLDETARVYDEATVVEAVRVAVAAVDGCSDDTLTSWSWKVVYSLRAGDGAGPWTAAQVRRASEGYDVVAACDTIFRRRAGGAP